jgi:hypothetical protein
MQEKLETEEIREFGECCLRMGNRLLASPPWNSDAKTLEAARFSLYTASSFLAAVSQGKPHRDNFMGRLDALELLVRSNTFAIKGAVSALNRARRAAEPKPKKKKKKR